MDVLGHCDCCERPLHKDEQTFWADDDATLCAKCAFELLRHERDVALDKLRGAVEGALNVLVQAATDEEGILDATKLANLVLQRLRHQSFGGQRAASPRKER